MKLSYKEYRAQTEEMVNEISDLCMTAIVTDQMSLDEVVSYYQDRLNRIYDICSAPGGNLGAFS